MKNKNISSDIEIIVEELENNEILDDDTYIKFYIKDKKDINLRSKRHDESDLKKMGFASDKVSISMEGL